MTEYVRPKRVGGSAGTHLERCMEEQVGGVDDIRKKVLISTDGTTVRLDTRAGNPRVIVSRAEGIRPVIPDEVGEPIFVPNDLSNAFGGWGAPFTYDGNGHTTDATASGAAYGATATQPWVVLRKSRPTGGTPEVMRWPEIHDGYALGGATTVHYGRRWFSRGQILVSWDKYDTPTVVCNYGRIIYNAQLQVLAASVTKALNRMLVALYAPAISGVLLVSMPLTLNADETRITGVGDATTLFSSKDKFTVSTAPEMCCFSGDGKHLAIPVGQTVYVVHTDTVDAAKTTITTLDVSNLSYSYNPLTQMPAGTTQYGIPGTPYIGQVYLHSTVDRNFSAQTRFGKVGAFVWRGAALYAVHNEVTATEVVTTTGEIHYRVDAITPVESYHDHSHYQRNGSLTVTGKICQTAIWPVGSKTVVAEGSLTYQMESEQSYFWNSDPVYVGPTYHTTYATVQLLGIDPMHNKYVLETTSANGVPPPYPTTIPGTASIRYWSNGAPIATMATISHDMVGGISFSDAYDYVSLNYAESHEKYVAGINIDFVAQYGLTVTKSASCIFGRKNSCFVFKSNGDYAGTTADDTPYGCVGAASFFDGQAVYDVSTLIGHTATPGPPARYYIDGNWYLSIPYERWKVGIL